MLRQPSRDAKRLGKRIFLRQSGDLDRRQSCCVESPQPLELILHSLPGRGILFGCDRGTWIAVESQNIFPQVRSNLVEIALSQLIEQARIGFVGERVLAGMRHSS